MVTGKNKKRIPHWHVRRLVALLSVVAAGALGLIFFTSLIVAVPAGDFVFPSPGTPGVDVAGKIDGWAADKDTAPAIASPSSGSETAALTALADGQSAVVRFDAATGAPAFLTGDIAVQGGGAPDQAAYAFLDTNRDLYRLVDPKGELRVRESTTDALGMSHVRLEQMYQGIPVFEADLAVHISDAGHIVAVNGKYVPGIDIPVEPAVEGGQASAAALAAFSLAPGDVVVESAELTVLAPAGADVLLAWKVVLTEDDPPLRQVVFIDAADGKVIGSYDDLKDVKNRKTYTANYGTSLPGTLLITEGGSSGDAVAQAAHDNIGATYDYYYNTFGRDSYNGNGGQLKSSVHYSNNYNNAFWNGSQMTYGDGDGYVFAPLCYSLDVVAHELTHGVTQYTAGLVYSYQSGALNESYSDVFGVMVDRNDWLLGEDVYTPQTPGDALRSLSNPAQYGQPAHMNNYVNTSSDNGGVHTNSGIPNKAAYNVATAIGRDKTEQIWYRTLTLYLTAGAQFTDARDASVQAATDLYGAGSTEVTAVVNGFSAVGIGGSQLSDMTARIEIDHPYRGDLVVTLGVGDPAAPAWSTVVSNRSGGSADNIYQTVDITEAAAYLPPDWQNRWFLKVYDAAGYDTGTIEKFSITDHDDTYTATGMPLPVNDYETVLAYVPTSDTTAPTAAAVVPQPGATGVYADSAAAVEFSESVQAGTVNESSVLLTGPGGSVPASVSYDSGARRATLTPAADMEYLTDYDVEVTTAVTDAAGNPMEQPYQWSFTTAPGPKLYYFPWYDMNSRSMSDWVVMGNPGSHDYDAGFEVRLNSLGTGGAPITVQPGDTEAATYPGQVGGPVTVAALEGESQIVSKRTLYGGSLEEIVGVAEDQLDSHYYFTWYDEASAGARDWILVSNPGETAVEVEIFIAGNLMGGSPFHIDPGATITPEFKGVIGGPVEVMAAEVGHPDQPRDIIVSQRTTWMGDFTEIMGIPAAGLSSQYLFTWYDMKSAGAKSWVLAANPHDDRDLVVEVWIAGQRMTDPASGDPFFAVPAGGSITPTFPNVMDGPVLVKGFDAQTYDPGDEDSPALSFYSTQRSLFGNAFEEVPGYGFDRLAPDYFFSWYDNNSSGSRDWVLVANPGDQQVIAEVWIAGTRMSVLTIDPGSTQTPIYPGVMNGPVEVRGYLASTYDADNPGAPDADVFSSQRVMWRGNFNEVIGTVID